MSKKTFNNEKRNKYYREYQKKWRINNPEKAKEKAKKEAILYKERHPDRVNAGILKRVRNWRIRNPEKVKAHRLVFSAIRNGSLKRKPCFCGNEKSEAHHNDYSKPLEVIWLCKKHHLIADKERKE